MTRDEWFEKRGIDPKLAEGMSISEFLESSHRDYITDPRYAKSNDEPRPPNIDPITGKCADTGTQYERQYDYDRGWIWVAPTFK